LDDKSLRVPSEFIRQASLAGDEVAIEVAGKSFPLGTNATVTQSLKKAGSLFSVPLPESVQVSRWPVSDTSPQWDSQSVLLVVNPELSEPLAIDGTRLAKSSSQRISVAPGVAIAPALSGSPVVHAASGKLLGLLVLIDNQWSIGTW
jgi:hypothetical protein